MILSEMRLLVGTVTGDGVNDIEDDGLMGGLIAAGKFYLLVSISIVNIDDTATPIASTYVKIGTTYSRIGPSVTCSTSADAILGCQDVMSDANRSQDQPRIFMRTMAPVVVFGLGGTKIANTKTRKVIYMYHEVIRW